MFSMKFIKLDLWRIWLVIFVTTLHIYLLYCSVRDYLSTKSLSFDPLYGAEWSQGPMGFKLSCILCSITFLPLIIMTSLIVTGNLANDGHVLGQDIDNNHFIIDSDSKGQIVLVDLSKSNKRKHGIFCSQHNFVQQQFVPISIFLQIVSGICYLIPLPFIEAQKLTHKALGSNFVWHTDLDFLINPDNEHEDFARGEPFHLPMRPAYFNLIFCFSLLTFRYPSVFWRTNRLFSLLFYFLIIILGLHILIDFSATSLLIHLSVPGYVSPELMCNIHPTVICFLSFGGSLILLILQMTVFNYGVNQYLLCLSVQRHSLRLQYKTQETKKNASAEETSNTSSDSIDMVVNESVDEHSCKSVYNKYCVNITAIFFCCLAMGMKAPLFIHQWRLYTKTGDRIMYLNVVIAIMFCIIWMITWFGFTIKSNWKFKVNFQIKNEGSVKKSLYASVGGVTCSTIPTTSTKVSNRTSLLGNTGSPVYATCHQAASSPTNTIIITPNHLSDSQIQSEEADLSNRYALLPQEIPDGILNRYVVNRYYSMENPNSKRVPIVRSPLLSYQFSAESSPSINSRKQMNNQLLSKVTFTDQFIGTEPDLISHGYPMVHLTDTDGRLEMINRNSSLDRIRLEYLLNDGVTKHGYLKEFSSSGPPSNNETFAMGNNNRIEKSPTNSTSNEMNCNQQSISHDFLMKLNGLDESNDEEERLCSQV